jgi:hypothetical protein
MSLPIYQSTRPRKSCIITAKDSEAIKLAAASVLNKAKDSDDTPIMKLEAVHVLNKTEDSNDISKMNLATVKVLNKAKD